MWLVLEELINLVLLLDVLEYISGEVDNRVQRLVQEVALEPQLEFSYILAGDTLIVKVEEFSADFHRVDVFKPHWEKHLWVTMKFLQHIWVAVFEHGEELFDLLEDFFLWLGGVDPLCQMVEQVLLEYLAVFFAPQLGVNRCHSLGVRCRKRFLGWAPIQIENK